jgi:hypothetical protein
MNLDYFGATDILIIQMFLVEAEFVERIRMMQFYARMVLLVSLEEEKIQEWFQKVSNTEEEMYTQSPIL